MKVVQAAAETVIPTIPAAVAVEKVALVERQTTLLVVTVAMAELMITQRVLRLQPVWAYGLAEAAAEVAPGAQRAVAVVPLRRVTVRLIPEAAVGRTGQWGPTSVPGVLGRQ